MANVLPYRPATGDIPTSPGVYRFLGDDDRVLYVGKAKNLRARLSNYFAPLERLHERTRHMVTTATRVEWTVVRTETEALQLEYTWIQEFSPPFNVKFKDDKSYPFMAVTLGDEAPRVLVTRNPRIRGARYFGPYPKVWAVNETIDLMVKAFPIRTCNDSNYKRAMQSGRPCFPGQIGRCGGPCSGRVTIDEHRVIVNEFVRFMESYDRSLLTTLQDEMKLAATEMRFEDAAKLRDRIGALENVLEKSAVVLPDNVDLDLFGIAEDELSASVQQFTVRGGRIRGVRNWVLDKELDTDIGTIIDQTMQRVYGKDGLFPPGEIIVPALPEDADALSEWLESTRQARVKLRTAVRGPKSELLKTATINAMGALAQYKLKRSSDYVARSDALTELQNALGLGEAPLRIECYDISHLQGTGIVGSMVVFEDGLARKSHYRRFNIASSTDDTDSIHQVLTRRLAYLRDDASPAEIVEDTALSAGPVKAAAQESTRAKFAYRPQLLLIDGGVPQVNAAQRALEESGVRGIAVVGIAKRLEELWLPDDDFPVILPRGSEALFLVQRLRDEAHRFAIRHQRSKRKADIGTVLADIPGLGPTRVAALLKKFGSVKRLRAATVEELTTVQGIGEATAGAISERFALDQSTEA
ncbi:MULTISPECIES: excinuclease ABC subunit UvrC [unclassified Pseudoclavibacter]|uniref:excinuclease ABC subunit UvrC n=1 Tax=unclassified Pseudoclavibacter TaxID=2615177 RepID=UPI000CE8A9B7|nr:MULTISPECIES: excinuclease ABC subunit UvrC [unclassified Pseudoclavibacter]MBF4549039.1 excinuclease ABC subunit UvrC [Pseudoclavibacter sp. VKM Ac-2888]PPF40190.1 excinuclease ABC subunit C [Pseudoclavibacter sp. AY1H1]